MQERAYEVYESIVSNTSSELILFFVILAVVVVPLYTLMLKGRKAAKQHERERERQIIEVIKENSTVIASLKTTLDNNGDRTKEALERAHLRLDEIVSKTNRILFIVDKKSTSHNPQDTKEGNGCTSKL